MNHIKRITARAWAVVRYMATGQTRGRRDRQALAGYRRYQEAERTRGDRS